MKTLNLFFILILIFSYKGLNAQSWDPDVRLTNNSGLSSLCSGNARAIASSGNTLHVAWFDDRDGNLEIYYKRSTDGGTTWQADTRITNAPDTSKLPAIAASGNNVSLVWLDKRNGNFDIYYNLSTTGGASWLNAIPLTTDISKQDMVSLSSYGSNIHVSWLDFRYSSSPEIFYRRSTDNGFSWYTEQRITANSTWEWVPAVSAWGNDVHLVFQDDRDGGVNAQEIYYKRSTDGGITWSADTRLTNTLENSRQPTLAAYGTEVNIAWYDDRDGNGEIYYLRSGNAGVSWQPVIRVSNANGLSWLPCITISGSNVHILWTDTRDGNDEIYYKRTTNAGLTWTYEYNISNNPNSQWYPSVVTLGTSVNVVWRDYRDGNYEIYYKRNTAINPVGLSNKNTGIPNEFLLSQNYPNPFNPSTTINFGIPKSSLVNINIFNALGEEIESLVKEQLLPGNYSITWDAANYPSGVYYYKLTAGGFTESKKMILVK